MLFLVLWLLAVVVFALLVLNKSLSKAESLVYSIAALVVVLLLAYPKIIARVISGVVALFAQ